MRNERLIPEMRFGALCWLALVVKKAPVRGLYLAGIPRENAQCMYKHGRSFKMDRAPCWPTLIGSPEIRSR
jgi:hypothetical protein